MNVNYFQLLLIDARFYFQHVWKLTGNVPINYVKNEYNPTPAVKGLNTHLINNNNDLFGRL